ncbi:MAG: nitroreductase family protein [Spirochaetes bacterium]|nr:nitroreductase family protein [Spirochaetota bacterium]
MALLKQIEARRARRALDPRPIERDMLVRLVEAAHLAPSFGNTQSWRIVTVVDSVRLEALKAALTGGNYWAKKSPAIAAFVTSPEWDGRIEGGREYAFFDLGQAAMAYQLQAIEEGLIVHPIAGFDSSVAKRALGIPETAVLETLIILGYPGDSSGLSEKHLAAETSARIRKPLDEVSAFDQWEDRLVPPQKADLYQVKPV